MKVASINLSLICLIMLYACCSSPEKDKLDLFKDNGRSIDSLKTKYQAQKIKFDRWEATGVTDSTFSICLVNAKILPDLETESSLNEFKSIARTVKYALEDSTKYNSYQIVFVETHEGFGESHRSGTTLQSKGL